MPVITGKSRKGSSKNGKSKPAFPGRKKSVRPGKKERVSQRLPGVTGVASVRKYNMANKTDKKLIEWLIQKAIEHPHRVWILFTRDINFMRDAQKSTADLPWNVHVLVLQQYVPKLQRRGFNICAKEIGTMSPDKLRLVMREVYLIWFHQS